MVDDGFIDQDLSLVAPVQTLHEVSHDPSLGHLVTLADGRRMTAVELQQSYHELAVRYVEERMGDPDPQTLDVLERWGQVLDALRRDPWELADQLDWVAKHRLLQQYRDRDGLGWEHPKLHLVDLQYADVRPEKGLYHRLVAAGRMQRLLDDGAVASAVRTPPEETRAYFRGRCLEKYHDDVAAASWDSVIFDLAGRTALQRVPTPDPLRGTRAHVEELLDASPTAQELLEALGT